MGEKHLKEEDRANVCMSGGGGKVDVKREWIPFSHLPTCLPSLDHFKIAPG